MRAVSLLAGVALVSASVLLFAFLPAPAAGTDVFGGTITEDTTWTLAGSPYRLLGSVSVGFQKTLEIGPGVLVLFTGRSSLHNGQGQLFLNGSVQQPVVLRAETGSPAASLWDTLSITAGHDCEISDPFVVTVFGPLDRCSVQYSEYGLAFGGYDTRLSNSTLRNMTGIALRLSADRSVVSDVTIEAAGTAVSFEHVGQPGTGSDPTENLLTHLTIRNVSVAFVESRGDFPPPPSNVLTYSEVRDVGTAFQTRFPGTVYANNFQNTTTDFAFLGGEGLFDNGYPSGGNFWSNYVGVDACSGPQQNVCTGGDGIGDTPYTPDRYPLMSPVPNAGASAPAPVPRIVASYPTPGAIRVSVRTSFWFDFSEPMNTLEADIFTLTGPWANLGGLWESPTRFRIIQDTRYGTLDRATAYTITIRGSTSSGQGVPLGADYLVTFTTVPPPVLQATEPANGTADVPTNAPIVLTFNVPMNRTAVEAAIRASPAVLYGFTWNQDDDTLTLVPQAPLAAGTAYIVTINGSATDADGMALPRTYVIEFSTEPEAAVAVDLVWVGVASGLIFLALVVGIMLGRRSRGRKGGEPDQRE